MSREQFERLVKRLEEEAKKAPKLYLLRVFSLVGLGFAYIIVIMGLLLVLSLLLLTVLLKSPLLLFKLGVPLIAVIWMILRSLKVKFHAPEGIAMTQRNAPLLMQEVKSLNRIAKSIKIHNVLLTNEFNASVVQIPRLGLFGWHRNYLIIGLPLMQALSREQFRAVLAHELGHLSRAHSKFHGWIYRVRRTWNQLMEQFSEKKQGWSFLFKAFIRWYAPKLNAYTFVLARENEYEADRFAAQLTSPAAMADALVHISIQHRNLENYFWNSMDKRAIEEEEPPLVYQEMHRFFREPQDKADTRRWLNEVLQIETGYVDTHPSLKDRLRSIGQQAEPPVLSDISSAEALLGDALDSLTDQFSQQWKMNVRKSWTERFHYYQQIKEHLERVKYDKRKDMTLHQVWEIAQMTNQLYGETDALPIYQYLIGRDPQFAPAYAEMGAALLITDEEEQHPLGVEALRKAMELDHAFTFASCRQLIAYYAKLGKEDKVKEYVAYGQQYAERVQLANAERAQVRHTDTFIPHELSEQFIIRIKKELQLYPIIKEAYLVRKKVEYFPEKNHYILMLKVKRPLLGNKKAFYSSVAQKVGEDKILPADTNVICLNLHKRFARVARNTYKQYESRLFGKQRGSSTLYPVNAYQGMLSGMLNKSVRQGNMGKVRLLLAIGANPNRIKNNEAPLTIAASEGKMDMMQTLLSANAQINLTNADGNTALFWAAYHNRIAAVEFLLQHGADTNIRFISGRSVLSAVCMHGYDRMLRILLEHGAKPIFTCYDGGETPLMVATYNGRYTCVQQLLNVQADPNIRDNRGNTALSYAQEYGFKEIAGLLRQYGAVL
ncbi:M48 family metalloprotease [Paenibacillus sp. LMG 31461]|uniref:M48 family metalloprotease n=1 Tax=Paenibacillus plantarum TaxID=2654975 RepID=A0ABX1X696_9BACL|nr:ankyrin repeat domain-containing protein [Paenibacillus plantarum]NOU63574.1 M48 family metalloprotease [Paenibacillus plantarum]